jgi:lysophospholipase L1-like esterase
MSVKPSPSRVKYYAEVYKANDLIKTYLKDKPKSHYVDLVPAIYKPGTTQPDSSLFKGDYLHLNPKGYDKWEMVLKPLVK